MSITTITEKLAISPQPGLEDIAALREQGFSGLINNRPENEAADQPGNVREHYAAGQAGLAYVFIPVRMDEITEADVRAFQQALAAADGPMLAHCKSGQRSFTLHLIGEVLDGRLQADELADYGQRFGLNTAAAAAWLQQHASRMPQVKGFYDKPTGSVQYVVSDPATRQCAIIDPVLDFDEKSGATATVNADAILAYVHENGLNVQWILDTHPHADHFSAAFYLKQQTGAPMAIGAKVTGVQKIWQQIYDWPELATDGSQWDHLFEEGEEFSIGSLRAKVMFSPGHTLASISYLIGDAAFVHDTMFMPDSGTARADFPGGDARALWQSIQAILALPDSTRVFTGHDYQPNGRAAKWESTVAQQKQANPHLAGRSEAEYVAMRVKRDSTLPMPKLILHALQVNIRGGRLPEPEANGVRYLKFPLNALPGAKWS